MSDVSEAVSQEQVADSLVAEPEQITTDTGNEEVTQSDEQPIEQEQEQAESEDDADWLPGEQEKVFPDEVISKYASRYGLTPEDLQANPSLRHLVHDKINSDIWARQQLQRSEELEQEPEQVEQPEQRPTQQQQFNPQQWLQSAQQFVRQNQLNNPEIAKAFAQSFMGAFGVNELPPNANPEALAETFAVFGMNLINSVLPLYFQAPSQSEGKNMLQYFLEQNYDGLGDMAQASTYRSAWDSVRNNYPELSKLRFGSDEFQQAMEKAEESLPGLSEMKFAGLSPKQNAAKQYQIAARILSGQKPNPELIAQAVKTGQRLAQQSRSRKVAGNLGAGNSKSQFSQGEEDDFFSNPASWNQYLDRKL